MTFVGRLASVENILQQDSAERALNKLARTFATQVEALKRYRTGGEQRVTVEHVHVHSGGQAIVGNVSPVTDDRGTGVGGDQENGEQTHGQIDPAALAIADCTALWGEDPSGRSMPETCQSRQEAVPISRRSNGHGCAEG
jgi:hypothetical protein